MPIDPGIENSLITSLFEDALAKSQAMRLGFAQALDVDNRLFTATGQPAPQTVKLAFRQLVKAICADGVLTDGERRQIVAFMAEHAVTLQAPISPAKGIDIDGIDL